MNKTVHLLVLHGLVVGLLSAWQLTHCLSCIFFLQGLLCHPCQEKVSLCTLKSEWTWVNPLRFLRSTRPVEARFTFQSPANVFCFVFCLFCCLYFVQSESADVGVGTGEDERRGWTLLSGSDHYGHREKDGDQNMWLQSRFPFCDISQPSTSLLWSKSQVAWYTLALTTFCHA